MIMAAPTSALAAGYGLHEESTDAMASAYAGAAATGTDASYLSYNPAAAGATDGGDISLNAISIMPSTAANYGTALTSAGTPTGGNSHPHTFVRNALIPDVAIRQRLDDRWSVGLSVSVPWGVDTNYPATWAGRYYGLQTKLVATNITPVVAYDVAPGIVLAGGFQAQYAKGTLSSAVDLGTVGALYQIPGSIPGGMDGSSSVNAHSWAYGYVLGARAVLPGDWAVGLSYRSAVHHTLKGPWTFTLDNAGLGSAIRAATGLLTDTTSRTKLVTPDILSLGLRKTLGDRWTALAELEWTNWTTFDALDIVAANPSQPVEVTTTQWKQAWMAALGAEYAADDQWALRAGAAYDGTPVPDSTVSTRIPDATRYWISAGATYHVTATLDLKVSVAHLFDGTRPVQQTAQMSGNALRGELIGATTSDANTAGFQAAYRW
jgi:long-chain fatty acid transport protein